MKMEAEAEAKRGYSKLGASIPVKKKRKPLSDLTNFATPNPKSLNPLKKPNNCSFKSPNPPLNYSTLSDSSIGSSNFNTPVPGYEGKRKDAGLPLDALMRVKTEIGERTSIPNSAALSFPPVEKMKHRGKATIAAHVEKTKDRGKTTIAVVENTKSRGKVVIAPHVEKTMEKGKATIAPYVENTKDKGKAIDVAFKVFPGEKTKDESKGVAGYASNHGVLKLQSKGEGIALSHSNISLESVKDKGKKSGATPCLPSLAKTKDKGKTVLTPVDFPTVEKRKEKGQGVSFSYSCPPLPKSTHIGNGLNESGDNGPSEFRTDPHMMHKKKRRCMPRDQDTPEYILPADFIEKQRAYFKEVDEFELLEEEASDSEK